jgi:hypothetical protein
MGIFELEERNSATLLIMGTGEPSPALESDIADAPALSERIMARIDSR